MRGTRRAPLSRIEAWAKRLGIDAEKVAIYVAAERAHDAPISARAEKVSIGFTIRRACPLPSGGGP
jgi:hypothetical protein